MTYESKKFWAVVGTILLLLAVCVLIGNASSSNENDFHSVFEKMRPHPMRLTYSVYRTAPISVAGVFGRADNQCSEIDPDLVSSTAQAAITASLDPTVLAAVISVESGCNDLAVSSRGAIGLTQVVPKVWKDRFDFGEQNLFNRDTNLRIGAKILSGLVSDYGYREALQRYQGLGVPNDPQYVSKILILARR